MAFEFKLPDLGEGVAEGEVVRWLVAEGDAVAEDQPLVEVMTDKATVEIPSPRAGIVARLGAVVGQTVPVGHVLVVIEEGAAVPAPAAARPAPARPAETRAAQAPPAEPSPGSESPNVGPAFRDAAELLRLVEATPAVRALARQRGVDLKGLRGSGPGGRVLAEDVERAARGESAPRAPAPAAERVAAAPDAGDEERVPLRGLRKRVAEAMAKSARHVPQFTFVAEADWTDVAADRDRRKREFAERGAKLTYLSYVLRALPESLRAFPYLNAALDEERGEIVLKKRIHIAVAVATPEGLTVPVVHDADRKDLFELAREVEALAEAGRAQRLTPENLAGATFTVTTTGAKGGVLATPIVHHPQVAILGVHAVVPRPAVHKGKIVVRRLGNLSLSLDHRVVDGQVGADFLYDLITRLLRLPVEVES
jgi:pyruvate dehydrogenase E2 component (dihydrolipoamide acetyltransferase)